MQHHDGLLLGRLRRHEPHRRPGDRLTDRLSVRHVVLLALHVGLHIAWRDQSHLMAQPGELASPVVRRTARLDPDETGAPLGEEWQHPAARQPLSHHDSALCIDPVYLEDRLRNVQSDRNNLFHGSPPSWAESRSCRRGGEPSTASKAAIDKMRAAAHFPDLRLLFDKRASYLHSLVNWSRSATNRSVPPCQPHAHA